ncbi:DNA methyltransferase [Thiohalorhabdus denitrificans]|uniref:site-specific DNA-methyltransferase (adenine-specific) n=1 Tax=Thiohalorhabdus denitrificans TaxID=381306 RepID=A0A0P9ERP6_9GAMM|nr:DNA methyltransferase [Thiohalorhabdus denitrificans]KPV41187.1 DNA methyltransferase [Thiohalorhabdus denitrificans]SCY35291.1 Type II restriction/modification system, DNA methylase subunit YeeA [Thiohalorhabdus denitrificans]
MGDQDIEAFITRWQGAAGAERSNAQLFLNELCDLLELPRPDPAREDTRDNGYVFERRVTFHHGDGSTAHGFIDLYRRGCFVLEAKGTGEQGESERLDKALLRARSQAERYARALPIEEGRPPLVIVTDVGRSIELYSEFSRSGATYTPFPDPRSHRISLEDLRDPAIRRRLYLAWMDPMALDPARQSARVTQEVADRLAVLARSLEADGHAAEVASGFLMRCLFTMFAEDVGLLPRESFTRLLAEAQDHPEGFTALLQGLWRDMNTGSEFSTTIRDKVLRFNGGLFAEPTVLPLDRDRIGQLLEAAQADWRHVEPAIFGTLLERALDPTERHKLGAHYTPRAYVERLVLPTVIEPLREDWRNVQAAAYNLEAQGKPQEAVETVQAFHRRLCEVRVLDPACGSGNFLYVTLEHMKRLEGEVLNALEDLGETQGLLELSGVTVDPHQLLGLETNPRAAEITDSVLWIGFLQWHLRTRGDVSPEEPVLKDFHNIECRDAVLDYDEAVLVTDDAGQALTHWDGVTYTTHPTTGERVPDETARVPVHRYTNPRKAEWPAADFVVGNPPFIGNKRMRMALGDGYVEALREVWEEVPESADFVMYWWHKAAELARAGEIRRFGLITTNSLPQTFNRRVLEHHMRAKAPLSLAYAIPNHPWVDSADGADVRIAMTVGEAGGSLGTLAWVISEKSAREEGVTVELATRSGKLHPDLTVGADVSGAIPLEANSGIGNRGVTLVGSGFIVTPDQAKELGLGSTPGLEKHIRQYRNGRDLTQRPRGVLVIDLYGLEEEEVRRRFPAVYQWIAERVKPEREAKGHTKDGAEYAKNWWQFGKPRPDLREMLDGLDRYIATLENTKHRTFVFLDKNVLPDNKLFNIALSDSFDLGILSSRTHARWSLASGSRLGVGNDLVYVNTRCFQTFPFPETDEVSRQRIRDLAAELDAHRKRQQAEHPDLTLTGMYNALDKLRAGEELTRAERAAYDQGLVSVLADLHDRLDEAVLAAYGWSDLAPALVGKPGGTTPRTDLDPEQAEAEEELLGRLAALNAERAEEEKRGHIRWLRPDYQNPEGRAPTQAEMVEEQAEKMATTQAKKRSWPKTLPEQIQAVREVLEGATTPVEPEVVARQFHRAQKKKVAELLDTLEALGQAQQNEEGEYRAA